MVSEAIISISILSYCYLLIHVVLFYEILLYLQQNLQFVKGRVGAGRQKGVGGEMGGNI